MADIDLQKELEKETETAQAKSDFDEPAQEAQAVAYDNDGDFDAQAADASEPIDYEPVIDKIDSRKMANRLVRAFNSIQKVMLIRWYRKSILHDGDKEAMERKRYSQATTIPHEGSAEYEQYIRVEKFLKYCDEVPLTQDEMDSIAEPLTELVDKYQYLRLSPESSLLLAVLIVMIPRLEPLFPNIGKMFTKKATQ